MGKTREETTYQYLEPRPHSWRKQYDIKGRRLTVGQLPSAMWANNQTPAGNT